MNKNSTFKEISEALMAADRIALFPHVNMDGDALGSCVAMAHFLSSGGKSCSIVLSESIPENLRFLDDSGFCTTNQESAFNSDLALLIDSGELKRIPGREKCFNSAKKKICIDHHGTSEAFCDLNYIDPDQAATGQIIWELIEYILSGNDKAEINLDGETKKRIAEGIFTAITTDTGNFQYSNTQKESHEIAGRLYDWGLNANKVSVEIYESNRVERLKLTAEVLSKMEIICDGRVAIAYCSQDMLSRTGAKMEETEWIAGDLRGIRGVEVAIFLKEEDIDTVKCSLRSKSYFDVASFAAEFGGGGHIRASGYTVHTKLEEAIHQVKKKITEEIDRIEEIDR